jgi:tRNA threonylcarbamoyladenosine biosynthesis protein TsaB
LRIGLAAARGMALAAGLRCVGVTSLEAVAEAIGSEERAGRALLVTLDSKRADIFAQLFEAGGAPLARPVAIPRDGLADILPAGPLIVAGTAAAAAVAWLAEQGFDVIQAGGAGFPHARDVVRVAVRRLAAGDIPRAPPSPLYLRAPDTGASQPAPRVPP